MSANPAVASAEHKLCGRVAERDGLLPGERPGPASEDPLPFMAGADCPILGCGLGHRPRRGPAPPGASLPRAEEESFWRSRDLPLSGSCLLFRDFCCRRRWQRGDRAGVGGRSELPWTTQALGLAGLPGSAFRRVPPVPSPFTLRPAPPQRRHHPGRVGPPALSRVKPSGLSALPRLLQPLPLVPWVLRA